MKPVPPNAIFVETEGVVYYVVNWQKRRNVTSRAMLIKLSKDHQQRYLHMKAKGRSQKSIYYFVFGAQAKRRPIATALPAEAPARPAKTGFTDVFVSVPLRLLDAGQLHALIQTRVGTAIPLLRNAPVADLRRLYLALAGGSRTTPDPD